MPDPTKVSGYDVNTFLDLQEDLADYLGEDATIDANWTIARKKKMINRGLKDLASRILTPRTFKEDNLQATVTSPIGEIVPPSNLLKPINLYITQSPSASTAPSSQAPYENSREWIEVEEEEFFRIRRGNKFRHTHVYFYDIAQRLLRLGHDITTNSLYEFYYVRTPKILVNSADVSDVDPNWTHLAAMWAANRLLYKDQEHRDKGISLLGDYERGIADALALKFKEAGGKSTKMKLNPRVFRDSHEGVNRHKISFTQDDFGRFDA